MSFRDEVAGDAKKAREALVEKIRVEQREKFERVSRQCLAIAQTLKDEVRKEASGKSEEHFGHVLGHLKYQIKDQGNEAGAFTPYEKKDVESTEGFKTLSALCKELGLELTIAESL